MKYCARLLAFCLLGMVLSSVVYAAEINTVLTYKNSKYTVTYDTDTQTLQCISRNLNCSWQSQVGSNIPGSKSWAGTATAAGPVFVYTSGSVTNFVLLHFKNGGASTEKGGISLRGGLAPGRLVSATWANGAYGTKATVVTVNGQTEYTTIRDINMWGTGKQLSQTTRTLPVRREPVPETSLSVEVAPGLSPLWDGDTRSLIVRPDDGRQIGILLNIANPVDNLSEFADLFMEQIGPAMGATDLQQIVSDKVTVGGKLPGLLRLAQCKMNQKPGTFAFVFFTAPQNTVVLLYAAPSARFDEYAPIFYKLVSSLQF